MSRDKQIEEMAKDLQETHDYEGCEAWHCGGCRYEKYGKGYFCSSIKQAEKMTAKGYRKVIEGEWKLEHETYGSMCCSVCGKECPTERKPVPYEDYQMTSFYITSPYCPYCGAKMKYESEGADDGVGC